MSKKKKLKVLQSHKALHVYFVRDSDKVSIEGKSRRYKIYKSGHEDRIENFDYDFYSDFIQEHGYQPPATKVGDVYPNPTSTKPGIEIMLAKELFRTGAYYMIFDTFGFDTVNRSEYGRILMNRGRARSKIDKFLREEVYAPLGESREAYEKNLVELIEKYLTNPHNLFDLHILSEPKAQWVRFDEIDLKEALDKGIRLNIDWCMANKVLAMYAIKAWKNSS